MDLSTLVPSLGTAASLMTNTSSNIEVKIGAYLNIFILVFSQIEAANIIISPESLVILEPSINPFYTRLLEGAFPDLNIREGFTVYGNTFSHVLYPRELLSPSFQNINIFALSTKLDLADYSKTLMGLENFVSRCSNA